MSCRKTTRFPIVAVLAAGATLSACGGKPESSTSVAGAPSSDAAAPSGVVQIDGSSTVYPITEAIAEEFQAANAGGARVTVGVSGTGGGFKKFCRGELDISNASRPIQQLEMEECAKAGIRYFELPIAFDALTVVVNPANPLSEISIDQLKRMWEPAAQGKVLRWNQVDPAWADAPLALYGAGSDSGTFDYFTEAVVGKAKSSRGDFTASEDDNTLVQGVAQDANAIGYFGYAYYADNQDKLKALAVAPQAGAAAVLPTRENVIGGTYQPLSRPLFIYVSEQAYARPEVKGFIDYYFANAARLADETRYVPLPDAAYATVKQHIVDGKFGTVFAGQAATGVTVESLLEREASL
jgi:phosphate transport system substrate-binding protein